MEEINAGTNVGKDMDDLVKELSWKISKIYKSILEDTLRFNNVLNSIKLRKIAK